MIIHESAKGTNLAKTCKRMSTSEAEISYTPVAAATFLPKFLKFWAPPYHLKFLIS